MMRFAFLAALLLAAPAGADDVYRCVPEDGPVRYAGKPCTDGKSEKLSIDSEPTDLARLREQARERRERIAAIEQAQAEERKQAAATAKQAEERQQACAAARERLQNLLRARRVTEGEGENMRFLESEEIVRRREQAREKVDELCGG